MIIHVVGDVDATGIKRALDRFLLLMVEVGADHLRNFSINTEMWSGDRQVDCVDASGRRYPVYLERYPGGQYWDAGGEKEPAICDIGAEAGERVDDAADPF